MSRLFCVLMLLACCNSGSINTQPLDSYPGFSNEQEITIIGYDLDAMEPFISRDGTYLFFNSLNNGVNTSLYYARRKADAVFELQGEITGVNQPQPHLDAVASMDEAGTFYFISTRNYPAVWENLQTGAFNNGTVTGTGPVAGDFYVRQPGWIVMDAEISADGQGLFYANARFAGQPFPEESIMGYAVRGEKGFIISAASSRMLENVNDPEYLVYAPSVSPDGKELYFTRFQKGAQAPEICVSTRQDVQGAFGHPMKIPIPGSMVEAPSISADGQQLYYHRKLERDGRYHVFMMQRQG